MKKRHGLARAVARLPREALEALPTAALLARLERLRRCEESRGASDLSDAEVDSARHLVLFKEDSAWRAAHSDLKAVLAGREHVGKAPRRAGETDEGGLDKRTISRWREAGEDLGIRVTAPAELRDADGSPFRCEALVADFGSPAGTMVVSAKTERRLRARLRGLDPAPSLCVEPARGYSRTHCIDALEDWGWFGEAGAAPDWYVERH